MAEKKKKKVTKQIIKGRLYIAASFNNTLVTVTDEKGEVIGWSQVTQVLKGRESQLRLLQLRQSKRFWKRQSLKMG